MLISKIVPSVDQTKWLKRFNTQLNELINQYSQKSPKLLINRIRKGYYKTLGTSVINSSLSPLSDSKVSTPLKTNLKAALPINQIWYNIKL